MYFLLNKGWSQDLNERNNKWKIAKLRQSCDSFCVHNMHETTFVCTIAIDNFCLHYYNWQLLFALLQLITFVCTTAIDNIFIQLQLTNIVLTIATVDMCLLQSNIYNIRYINCNGAHKLITALKLVWNLLRTDILTYRAAIAAWNAKYDNILF